jgi:membrane protease YdiL (CAAX protease family)
MPDRRNGSTTRFDAEWSEVKLVAWLFGALLASSFVVGIVDRMTASILPMVSVEGIDALVVFAFAVVRHKDVLARLVVPRFTLRTALEIAAVTLASILALIVYFAVLRRLGIPLLPIATDDRGEPRASVGLLLVSLSLMPAVIEELAFRGIIQSALERVVGWREAWVIQAALFSVLHLLPLSFPSHFLIGLYLGYVRLRSKSLYPGMVLHGSWNAFVVCQELHWI